jgi:uncharacterized membrane protein
VLRLSKIYKDVLHFDIVLIAIISFIEFCFVFGFFLQQEYVGWMLIGFCIGMTLIVNTREFPFYTVKTLVGYTEDTKVKSK